MPSKKTRPIGIGQRNVPVTFPNADVAKLETLAGISGVKRSPYLRALAYWAMENGVVLRPKAEEYQAHIDAIARGDTPPKYGYEIIITRFTKPIRVILAPNPENAAGDPEPMLMVAEDPHNPQRAPAPIPPAARQRHR